MRPQGAKMATHPQDSGDEKRSEGRHGRRPSTGDTNKATRKDSTHMPVLRTAAPSWPWSVAERRAGGKVSAAPSMRSPAADWQRQERWPARVDSAAGIASGTKCANSQKPSQKRQNPCFTKKRLQEAVKYLQFRVLRGSDYGKRVIMTPVLPNGG